MGLEDIPLLMHTWLGRAGDYPLSISITSGDTSLSQDLWSTFFAFSSRWRHIKVNSLTPSEFPRKLEVPLLETFELFIRDYIPAEHCLQLPRMVRWSSASGLRQFSWVVQPGYGGYDYSRMDLDFDWSRLTHLKLHTDMSLEDCLGIFEKSQALTHAVFQYVTVPSLPSSRDLIHLPQLQSLCLRTSKHVAYFLDSLVLPNIREFIFMILEDVEEEPWSQTSFLRLIDRSQCTLKNLYFYYLSFTPEQLLDCLRCTKSSLTALTLQTRGQPLVTDEVLDVLTVKDGRCLCPKLQVLALYDCISCSAGRVADMVKSRLAVAPIPTHDSDPQAIACMQVVEMYEYEKELEPLKALRRQGLILKVYSATGESLRLSPEDEQKLRYLQEEELISQMYDSDY